MKIPIIGEVDSKTGKITFYKMNIDLTERLLNKFPPKKGKIGRYHASDLWAMLNGYCSPREFLEGRPKDFKGAMNCFKGIMKHEAIQSLLEGGECEVKREYKIGDITLVLKVDWIGKDHILEIKTSDKIYDKAKRWAEYQARLYASVFELPVWIVQPITGEKKLSLKVISEVKPNPSWFDSEMEKLKKYHEEVKKVATLQECLNGCESFNEACEKCGKIMNKYDRTAQELWEEHVNSTK